MEASQSQRIAPSRDLTRTSTWLKHFQCTGTTYYGHHLEGLDIKMPGAGGVGRETCSLDFTQTPDTLKVGQLLTGFKPHEDNQD